VKRTRKIIEIDDELCDGCGQCVPSCAEGAIEIVDGKAKLVADKYCDGLGACLGECPTGALTIVEREAEAFDEEAVQKHLNSSSQQNEHLELTLPCGCPSAEIKSFEPCLSDPGSSQPLVGGATGSALSHWPVQIRLVPPEAPFLKRADLLVAADCTPFAYGNFHEDFLKGKVALVGCPKFDDVNSYVDKFSDIFSHNDINSILVLVMEVPCCRGLPKIVEKALETVQKPIPAKVVEISRKGAILKESNLG
jgi:Pyruvate/2-oxoacid:ferredoxin oxidoreductase delta subunit